VALALASVGSCRKEAPPAPPPAPAATPSAPAGSGEAASAAAGTKGSGAIAGTVKLVGTPPEMALTKRQGDPFCARTPMKEEEVVVGAGGALKNVVVRVTSGVAGRYDPPAENAVLDQSACMYRPRVSAAMLGQNLLIKNSDQTLHNVHGYKGPSTLFNQAQVPNLGPITKKLTDADQILKFKCDVHPWMTAYVLVSSHPFFAVTGDDGRFRIADLPPGKYTLEAWHERYGTKTSELTVAADKPAEIAFQYESR
jgi:hypothetical protein